MRKTAVVAVLALVLSSVAWPAGSVDTGQRGAFKDSVAVTLDAWFPAAEEPPGPDLTGLLLVSNQHRRGPGHRVGLSELDERLSMRQLKKSQAQRLENRQQWPEVVIARDKARGRILHGLASEAPILRYPTEALR